MNSKPRVLKAFENLDDEIKERIKLEYPTGFHEHLIKFQNKEGNMVSALPFETEEKYYLVKMSVQEAKTLIEEDDDYDDEGMLRDDVKEEYEDRHEVGDDEEDDLD